ncbi:MAG TPA: DUF3618 domain-containing protein [Candidatus Limnocylindrales bacterium]|nr:DUF3618 domain-containing protein [Candidatus Limnocylindrales bacterium]
MTDQDESTRGWNSPDANVDAHSFDTAGDATADGLTSDEITAEGVTADPEIDQLVEEIVYTREEMTGTVEEIGDRLDPKNIVAQATGSVRDATIGKVESVATSASDMVNNVGQTAGDVVGNVGQTAQQAGSGIVESIRRNPVPAAMIGIGLGWLALSSRGSSSSSRYNDWSDGGRNWSGQSFSDGGRMAGETWDTTGYGDTGYGGSGTSGQGITDKVGGKVGQVQQTAGEVVGQVQQTAGEVPYQVQNVARQVGDNAGRVAQENPLALGAIALAVGTAVGMALPTTKPERQFMGQARDTLIDKAETKATEAMSKVEESAQQ